VLFGVPPEKMIDYILYFELSFAIAYVLAGLFLAKTPVVVHILSMVVVAAGLFTGLYFWNNFAIVAIIGFVMYCLWMFITVLSAFSFSRNLFGNKITGSILFMGKKEGGSALFSGIVTPLIALCCGLNGYILYSGITLSSWLYITTGAVGLLMDGFTLIVMWVLAKKDDIFYSILPLFYVIVNTHSIQLAIRLIKGDTNYISWLHIVVSVLFLLNSIGRYYRKVKKIDKQTKVEVVEQNNTWRRFLWRRRDATNENEQNLLVRLISDRGVVMNILGFALSFHAIILQIGFNKNNYTAIFQNLSGGVVQSAHSFTLFFAALVVGGAIMFYYLSNRFFMYASPEIYRLQFLPTYEEIEQFIVDAKEGNINWKLLARDATLSMARKGVRSTAEISVSAKDRVTELTKKGLGFLKEKADTAISKAKEWREQLIAQEEEEDDWPDEDN
jgi:hypothetical protein